MIDQQKAEIQCEQCGNVFEIFSRNYEKVVQEDTPILCAFCFSEAMEKQEENQLPRRKQFKYTASKVKEEAFKELGKQGWELVQIANNRAYFKREYVEGLE